MPKILILALFIACRLADQFHYSPKPIPGYCNPSLLASYNLEVVRYPVDVENRICGHIKNNCCTNEAQYTIYRKWVRANEKERLLRTYKTFLATYSMIYDDFKMVEEMAEMVQGEIRNNAVTNCGLMSKTILELRASAHKEQVNLLASRAYRFIYDSRRGFYCSLCDADAHHNYNTLDGTLHFSHGFCRDLIRETMPFNQWRWKYFMKVSRLYGHFLSTCEVNGKYISTEMLPSRLKFFKDAEISKNMEKCIKNSEGDNAIEHCYEYCSEFNPTRFSKLFEGDFQRLLSFRIWLNKNVMSKIYSALHGFSKDDLSFVGRLLSENPTGKAADKKGADGGEGAEAEASEDKNKPKKKEGEAPKKSTKYILRTDILHEKKVEKAKIDEKFKKNQVYGQWHKHYEPSCLNYTE